MKPTEYINTVLNEASKPDEKGRKRIKVFLKEMPDGQWEISSLDTYWEPQIYGPTHEILDAHHYKNPEAAFKHLALNAKQTENWDE